MNQDADFEGYMESMAQAKAREEQLAAHQLWKESTWLGKFMGLVQAVGEHFRPFVSAVASSLREEKSIGSRLLVHFIRVSIVLVAIMAIYFVCHLIQMIIGKEIVMEQEVIIEEVVRMGEDSDKHDASVKTLKNSSGMQRRSARDKKSQ